MVMDVTKKQSRNRKIRGYIHDFGKFLVDIAKLAFGSLVLGTAIRWNIPHTTLFFTGILFFFYSSSHRNYISKDIRGEVTWTNPFLLL